MDLDVFKKNVAQSLLYYYNGYFDLKQFENE